MSCETLHRWSKKKRKGTRRLDICQRCGDQRLMVQMPAIPEHGLPPGSYEMGYAFFEAGGCLEEHDHWKEDW